MPLPHLMIRLIRANNTYFLAGRGGFKTTMGIKYYVIDTVTELPRSTGIIVGPSYEHLGDNTLNPLFNSLNEDGFEPGIHYVARTAPPSNWEKPLIRVDSAKKYDHMISWWNGTNHFLISLAKQGSANGISAQHGVFDELKLMDERTLIDVVYPVFRGNEKAIVEEDGHPNFGMKFIDSPLFMSKFFATDKLADPAKINWILKKRELNNPKKLDIILSLQLALNDLKEKYNHAGINNKSKLSTDIKAIEVRLAKLRANTTFYVESDHTHTQQILGERWYQDKVRSLANNKRELAIAIENKDPDKPENGFYPDFDKVLHVHTHPSYNSNQPLIIAPDYQHSVSPIPIAQIGRLPGKDKEMLLYIDEVYTLAPQGLEDAINELCSRYAAHNRKTVYYIYDHTAKGKRNDAERFNEIVLRAFHRHSWRVVEIYTGKAPNHYEKYSDTKAWLLHTNEDAMEISIHTQCVKLIASISNAPAKVSNGKTEKDKRYEDTTKYPRMDQSETTHFSDSFDMTNHGVIKLKRVTFSHMGGLAFR